MMQHLILAVTVERVSVETYSTSCSNTSNLAHNVSELGADSKSFKMKYPRPGRSVDKEIQRPQ